MIRWGVIGAGNIAVAKIIPAIRNMEDAQLVHVMNRDKAKAARIAFENDAPAFSDRADAVWKDTKVDAVYIATPPHLHAVQTICALNAGKHVLCEKPMAMKKSEGEEMIRAAESARHHLMIAHQMRFHHSYRQAQQLLAQGVIGEVRVIQIDHLVSLPSWFDIEPAVKQYRLVRIFGGGTIMDMGIHDFDGVRFILQQEIAEVCALGGPMSFTCDVDDSAVVLFRTQDGALGTLGLSFDTPMGTSKILFHGSRGTLMVEQKAQSNSGRVMIGRDDGWQEIDVEPQNPYEAEIAHFAAVIRGDEEPLSDGISGLRSLRVALACIDSIQRRVPVIV